MPPPSEPFWTAARERFHRMKPIAGTGKNVFAGGQILEKARLDEVALVRWSVWPAGAESPPSSFAIVGVPDQAAWRPALRRDLPLRLRWRQETDSRWLFDFPIAPGASCHGLGERYSGLELRGRVHSLFATDDHEHTESTDAMYQAIPFLIQRHGERCIGLFLDSPARQRWNLDVDLEGVGHVELLSRRGWTLYALGPCPLPDLLEAWTTLVGRSPMPPLWSLGHQQSRWSYPSEGVVRTLARQFRRRRIPCDTLVVDIDHMDEYRVFTVSRERFPRFERMTRDLARDGFRVVTIVDPAVKRDARFAVYAQGRTQGHFCRTARGPLFVARVWPGASCLPDFLRTETRRWWGDLHRLPLERGIAGIWNDMNEPSLFGRQRPLETDARELPDEGNQLFLQEAPEGRVGHFEVRNLYGLQMSRATCEGLRRLRPDERPFVLTRSGYAGIQRYAAVWLGDNYSWWEHLRLSIPMLLNMGLSGVPFVGVDVGGFGEDATGELLARWYQAALFYPFFRNHCALGHHPQEPWAFGPRIESAVRRMIETRYQLLPVLQALFQEHVRTGAPILRPLFWHYPRDPEAAAVDDQFLLGPEILVAPILRRGAWRRPVYLPEGLWHPFDGRPPVEGGRFVPAEWKLEDVPAFVRDGAILPLLDPVQHTGEAAGAAITFRCFGASASGHHYEDDGRTFGYERGEYEEWDLRLEGGRFTMNPLHAGPGRGEGWPERGGAGTGREFRWQSGTSDHPTPIPSFRADRRSQSRTGGGTSRSDAKS